MRRQIPDDIAIMLEQAQVDSGRIVVVELAQNAFVEQFPDSSHYARKQERVIHHDLEVLLLGEIDEFFGLRYIASERLLDKHMLAVFESSLGEVVMRPDGSDHRNCVDVR